MKFSQTLQTDDPNDLVLPRITNKNRHSKVTKPIPIGAHHTVSGHEAMDLAKRLTDELASQQSGSLGTQRAGSPETEPRSRSYDQKKTKEKGKIINCVMLIYQFDLSSSKNTIVYHRILLKI